MMGLPDGRKSFKIGLAILIQYQRVTDRHPATQPASHVVVATTALTYYVARVIVTAMYAHSYDAGYE